MSPSKSRGEFRCLREVDNTSGNRRVTDVVVKVRWYEKRQENVIVLTILILIFILQSCTMLQKYILNIIDGVMVSVLP
jgi:hypothetical protein